MAEKSKHKGLGRGLSSLLADVNMSDTPEAERKPLAAERMVPIERIHPNPDQPRRTFVESELTELSNSIAEKGVIQPLIVRPDPSQKGEFQIVAGERRWRASQLAKLHELPVVVRDLSDVEVLEIAIIENIQRADLNAVDEAQGYRQLMDKFGHTQEQVGKALGKSRSHIANLLRLLNLPNNVLSYLRDGKLSAGHARALVNTQNPSALAREIIQRNLSVREAEALVRKGGSDVQKRPQTRRGPQKDADTRAIEADLSAHLGVKVEIDHKTGGQSGEIKLKYKDLEQLDNLCRLLTK